MMKKYLSLIVLFLLIAMTPKTQPLNDDKILHHPEIQRVVCQNLHLEMKLRELVEKLPSNLNTEYLARRIASILETCREPEELDIYFNELTRDLRNFSEQMLENQWTNIPIKKANNAPLNTREKEIITTVIEDFQVNENEGSCYQGGSAIAVDSIGNFVIVWEDERNANWDIYARRFDSTGQPLDSSFQVAENGYEPAVGMDGVGNFVIIWKTKGGQFAWTGAWHIWAQRYDSNGTALREKIRVNDDALDHYPFASWKANLAIAVNSNGNFVITWYDRRNKNWTGHDIYAQRFNSNGDTLGVNFQVNDDTTVASQYWPDAAIDNNGNFVISWEDHRNGNKDIYAQRYDSKGDTLGGNSRVNDDTGNRNQGIPGIDIDSYGNFVIVWEDERNGKRDIYAQVFSTSGDTIGRNFIVNDNGVPCSRPTISINDNGSFVISWVDERNRDFWGSDIYAQCFDSTRTPIGTDFRINDDITDSWQGVPTMDMDSRGNFVIALDDMRNLDRDIYAQRYNSLGDTLGANFRVNDDKGSSFQLHPAIGIDGDGNFVITWTDLRNGSNDIYAQCYSANGQPLEKNFRVNDIQSDSQEFPAIAVDSIGNFVITWQDFRNGNWWDIYYRLFTVSGEPISSDRKANDNTEGTHQFDPAIDMDDNGNFVITWKDGRSYWQNLGYDIYAQRFNFRGDKLGSNFRVNDDIENIEQSWSDVAVDGSGNFVIVWQDYRNGWWDRYWRNADIYAQRYNSTGESLGVNFRVNGDTTTSDQCYPAAAINKDGDFIIAWEDWRNGNGDIYFCSSTGICRQVNDDIGNSWQGNLAIDFDSDGNFLITWADSRNGNDEIYGKDDIYAQRYDPNGNPQYCNYRVNNEPRISRQYKPAVATSSGNIYFAWEDDRIRGQGWDIFAKVVRWDWTKVKDKEIVNTSSPERFFLLQNYPNPFNSETIIHYQLPKSCKVTLQILNLLGQEVKTLIDETMEAGYHKLNWDGSNNSGVSVASGIYLYCIEAEDFRQVKKLVIIR